jgi:hypothetical protein
MASSSRYFLVEAAIPILTPYMLKHHNTMERDIYGIFKIAWCNNLKKN